MAKMTLKSTVIGASTTLIPAMTFAQEISSEEKFVQDFAILGIWVALPIVIISIIVVAASLEDRRRIKLIEQFVVEGRDIPAELLLTASERKEQAKANAKPQSQRTVDLRRGVWLLCLGLGIALATYLISGSFRIAAWGLIFLFLSGASFINAMFATDKNLTNSGVISQK